MARGLAAGGQAIGNRPSGRPDQPWQAEL